MSPEDLDIHKLKAGRAQDFIGVLSVLQRQAASLDRTSITGLDRTSISGRVKRLGIWEEWQPSSGRWVANKCGVAAIKLVL